MYPSHLTAPRSILLSEPSLITLKAATPSSSQSLMQMEPRTTFNIVDERRDMLDRLNEIQIKGFHEIDETPTSGTTSLPTPLDEPVPLDDSIEDLPAIPLSCINLAEEDERKEPPGAPRMEMMDSFEDGTIKGSFHSIPAASTDEHGLPIVRLAIQSLAELPSHDPCLSIEEWRENVSLSTLRSDFSDPNLPQDVGVMSPITPTKRPRSVTSEEGGRRIRPRAQSLSSASSVSNTFVWVSSPSPAMHEPRRPPSRTQSLPPD